MQVDSLDNIRKERTDTLTIAEFSLRISPEKSDSQRILKQVIQNWNKWPLSKLNRWLGYAQCCLVTDGITTINNIRQETRNIINTPVVSAIVQEEPIEPVETKKKKKKKKTKVKKDNHDG